MATDLNEVSGRVVMFHRVAVRAGGCYIIMIVHLQAMIDPVDSVEATGIITCKAATEGTWQRHNSLSIAFEDSPVDLFLCCNTLVATKFGD